MLICHYVLKYLCSCMIYMYNVSISYILLRTFLNTCAYIFIRDSGNSIRRKEINLCYTIPEMLIDIWSGDYVHIKVWAILYSQDKPWTFTQSFWEYKILETIWILFSDTERNYLQLHRNNIYNNIYDIQIIFSFPHFVLMNCQRFYVNCVNSYLPFAHIQQVFRIRIHRIRVYFGWMRILPHFRNNVIFQYISSKIRLKSK